MMTVLYRCWGISRPIKAAFTQKVKNAALLTALLFRVGEEVVAL